MHLWVQHWMLFPHKLSLFNRKELKLPTGRSLTISIYFPIIHLSSALNSKPQASFCSQVCSLQQEAAQSSNRMMPKNVQSFVCSALNSKLSASFLSSFHSDCHMVLCWVAERTIIWVWFSIQTVVICLLFDCTWNLWSWTSAYPYVFWKFGFNQGLALLLCFSLWGKHSSHSQCLCAEC